VLELIRRHNIQCQVSLFPPEEVADVVEDSDFGRKDGKRRQDNDEIAEEQADRELVDLTNSIELMSN